MFESFKVASHIFTGTLQGAKQLFDEIIGGLLTLARIFHTVMQSIEDEVNADLKKSKKASMTKPKGKKKVA